MPHAIVGRKRRNLRERKIEVILSVAEVVAGAVETAYPTNIHFPALNEKSAVGRDISRQCRQPYLDQPRYEAGNDNM